MPVKTIPARQIFPREFHRNREARDAQKFSDDFAPIAV
jgi:hypothetical protein